MSDFESTSEATDPTSPDTEGTGLDETAPGAPQREDAAESGYEPTSSDTGSAPQEGLDGSDQSLQQENAETSLDQPSDG